MNQKKRVRVLIVDDSALVREILAKGLGLDPEIEVVGTAADPYIARDKIVELHPDVLTLDVEMPRMDGVEFLRRLMPQHPLPVLMVSALTQRGKSITLDALEAGAVDFVSKPASDVANGLNGMLEELRTKVKIAATVNVSAWKKTEFQVKPKPLQEAKALEESTDKVIAIGASTGGTEALRQVLMQLPADTPGVVIVQHMPAGFTKMFAERLNEQCTMAVKEAEGGDRILRGRVLIAPGDYHMTVHRSGGNYIVKVQPGDKVCGHRPSVEVMMQSVARNVGANSIGVILTGMGHDGAGGLLAMRQAGARTLAQDEATSVVFGMPKVAFERGGAEKLVPLPAIAGSMRHLLVEAQR
jgi:two-component system, chemotaxis family, protein-glutamate methylesterase/glutaminase